ncbi:hypothetical protein ACI3L1_17610 [Deinococcus sp. SM5_A1]|uniref:hypothetical protein n=1 Tax=Deinococcus sp. SM5_A1 TaxID=3379094 RepID=UPI00385BA20D
MPKRNISASDLLSLAEKFEEVAEFYVGGLICIERRHRPWRIQKITDVTENSIMTESGFAYDPGTGSPLFETKEHWLKPLTSARLQYVIVMEFLKASEKIKVNALTPEEIEGLLPAARAVLLLSEKMSKGQHSRLLERRR